MRKHERRMDETRLEVVTATFVASGRPEGVHDLGRLLENLNNPALHHQIELHDPIVRPLYSADEQLALDVPLVVRREDVIFATFEGPHFTRGLVRPPQVDAPVLLLAPPFQIQGTVSIAPGAERSQALRGMVRGFFAVRDARVFAADGAPLGEGEQIAVNGAAVQMFGATARHIAAAEAPRGAQRAATPAAAIETVAEAARRAA